MAQKKYTDGNGVSEIWLNIKNYVYSQLLGKADSTHTHTKSEITDFPSLATVATSGSYNDLSNKPTIPSNTNQLTNGAGYITSSGSCNYANSAGSVAWSNVSGRPTAVSQFTNDSGYITSADLLPVGSYIQFAGSKAPAGFLVCNGGAISRTTYSKLFAVIGTTYGKGNGSTTFNLPNLTNRFLQGSTTSGTVKKAGLPNITGNNYALYYYGSGDDKVTGAFYSTFDYINLPRGTADVVLGECDVKFDASRSNSIYGSSSTVQPPALTCLICIKY